MELISKICVAIVAFGFFIAIIEIIKDIYFSTKKEGKRINMVDREKSCIDALVTIKMYCKTTKEKLSCSMCTWSDQNGECGLKINDKTPDEWNPSHKIKTVL